MHPYPWFMVYGKTFRNKTGSILIGMNYTWHARPGITFFSSHILFCQGVHYKFRLPLMQHISANTTISTHMQEYPVKRTHIKALPENVTAKITEHFGVTPVEKDGWYTISYGALESMQVKLGEKEKTIIISTLSKQGVEDEDLILDTNKRFRRYLDEVTGYTSKERIKKAKACE